MQQKGEREIMTNGECCRYIRTYSELEGLQKNRFFVVFVGFKGTNFGHFTQLT